MVKSHRTDKPAANATVTAYFVNPTFQAVWAAAKAIIEATDFSVLQKEANTQTELIYRLADIIIKFVFFKTLPTDTCEI